MAGYTLSSTRFQRLLATAMLLASCCSLASTQPKKEPLRAVTAQDAVSMRVLSERSSRPTVSPNDQRFLFVTRRANVANNTNEFSMHLWDNSGRDFRAPVEVASLASSSNRPGIDDVSWSDDNRTVLFLGEHPGESHQLYRLDVETGTVSRITDHSTSLSSYGVAANADTLAYVAEEPAGTWFDDERSKRFGFAVSGQRLNDVVANKRNGRSRLYVKIGTAKAVAVELDDEVAGTPFVSPDGKYIAIGTRPALAPSRWTLYTHPRIATLAKFDVAPNDFSLLQHLVLVDTSTLKSRVLVDAPIDLQGVRAAWSPDGRSLVVSGILPPLDENSPASSRASASGPTTLEVDPANGHWVEIQTDNRSFLRWDRESGDLIFEEHDPRNPTGTSTRVRYVRKAAGWERDVSGAHGQKVPEFRVQEDMNTPPVLYVMDPSTGKRTLLLDLNPQFKQLRFARVEQRQWKGSDGHDVKGGLYYPPGYQSGTRYPLIIQTHGWNPNRFWPDGASATAFAAQALAARGFLVLQVDQDWSGVGTAEELRREVASLEGAIDDLNRSQLIDRDRVGIIGWSRTCLFVKEMLAHSGYKLAAASVTDGVDEGYFQYIAYLNSGRGWTDLSERPYGTHPFTPNGISKWAERSPSFAIENVTTPLRIVATRPGVAIQEWEWFVGLQRLRRPVEMIVMEDAEHELYRPWERLLSQQGNVDWFEFWLNGREDPDPEKAEQYRRWRELRKLPGTTPMTRSSN